MLQQVRSSEMRVMFKVMTGAGVLALSTGFAAAAPAVVENDLNLRAGPGPEFAIVAAMPAGSPVDVMGCEASWCRVAFNGTVGWASRAYMGLGGGVAVAPAFGYGERYAFGGYEPGDGYYGTPGPRYGYYEGDRSFGSERRFSEDTAVGGERRVAENTTIRSERRSGARAGARGESERAAEIGGNNPMKAEKSQPAAGASGNVRAETRGNATRGSANARAGGTNTRGGAKANASATTGAASSGDGEEDQGPNFIGPGKNKVDNH